MGFTSLMQSWIMVEKKCSTHDVCLEWKMTIRLNAKGIRSSCHSSYHIYTLKITYLLC